MQYEATRDAHRHYQYSGEKARRELGWQPGDPAEQWRQTLAEERRRAGKQ